MEKDSITAENLYSDVIKKAFFLIIAGIAGYFISQAIGKINPQLNSDLKSIVVGAFIIVVALIISSAQIGVKYFSTDLGSKYMKINTGIVKIYKNLLSCETDMKTDLKTAKNIRMLLQIGRREIGNSEDSFFYELIKEKTEADNSIKIMHASVDSPFLSEERALYKKSKYVRWQENLRRLITEIEILQLYEAKIQVRTHKEPFLWRIFIFDDIAYVSAYLFKRENDQLSKIYRIVRGENSLFTLFDKYFNYLWELYDPVDYDPINKWATWD